MKKYLFIFFVIILFLSIGFYLERIPYFSNVKEQLQKFTIPSPPLRFGKRGEIMEKLNLKYYSPIDYSKYYDPHTGTFRLRDIISVDASRPGYKNKWIDQDRVEPGKLPSSLIMDEQIIKTGLPILSVVVDEFDLYDERTGIFTNHQQKGKKWERLSFISYYDHAKLLFASGVGVRVHGGGDRSQKYKGLRFYFREIYGAKEFKRGILFTKKSEPIQRLILRKEPWFFNAIALDISREIGCIAPYTQPVRAYFNGSLYDDNFVLTEHISEDYLFSLFGHDNFLIERTIKRRRSRSSEFKELKEWASDSSIKMTMAEANKKVNVENLSLWWISQIYCAGKDHYQGPAVLDKTKKDSKWFWINWDMDQSIRNTTEKEKKIWEQELCLYEVMNNVEKLDQKDPRGILFRRMMKEDPEYRKYFENLFTEVLNHRISKVFFESRITYYEQMGKALGVRAFNGDDVRLFFQKRPAFLMRLMQHYFNAPESYRCNIKVPNHIKYDVDGYPYIEGYEGWYFSGSTIEIKLTDLHNTSVKYWLLNGKKIVTNNNSFKVDVKADVLIVPVLS